ncbi:MAG TPA: RHS repeat-associated core domain-containing protein, partial [Bacteroidales bacterium]|nr:RHS repeat-associated core domain-containing protein [Bacteroidales bacterium]
VRKTALTEGEAGDKTVEILYPSMYHGIERTKATARSTTDSDSYAVNNIYVNGVRIAAVSGDGAERHYFTDQVDSVKLIMDGDGKPIKAFEYLPYGETWLEKGESNDNPKYNSQELDKETGYYYYNARHYDAALARFVTADTVIDGEYSVAGWNRYMYCAGNPVLYKDPSGHNVAMGYLDSESKRKLDSLGIDYEYDGGVADGAEGYARELYQGYNPKMEEQLVEAGLAKSKKSLACHMNSWFILSKIVGEYDGEYSDFVKESKNKDNQIGVNLETVSKLVDLHVSVRKATNIEINDSTRIKAVNYIEKAIKSYKGDSGVLRFSYDKYKWNSESSEWEYQRHSSGHTMYISCGEEESIITDTGSVNSNPISLENFLSGGDKSNKMYQNITILYVQGFKDEE